MPQHRHRVRWIYHRIPYALILAGGGASVSIHGTPVPTHPSPAQTHQGKPATTLLEHLLSLDIMRTLPQGLMSSGTSSWEGDQGPCPQTSISEIQQPRPDAFPSFLSTF